MDETIITEENFNQYFFDARHNKPKKGQVLAKFKAVAEFIEGPHKRDVIQLLVMDKANEAVQVMERIHGCKPPWSYRVLIEMSNDLLTESFSFVEKHPYEMVIEHLYWTDKENVPISPNWETIDLISYDEETNEYRSEIVI